jgi:hypothetical protein
MLARRQPLPIQQWDAFFCVTGGASEKYQSNILRINKNWVIYFGLLLLCAKYKSLGAPFWPAGGKIALANCSCRALLHFARGFHSEFQLKVSLSCSNTLSLISLGLASSLCNRPCRACCTASARLLRADGAAATSIHSLALHSIRAAISAILQFFLCVRVHSK